MNKILDLFIGETKVTDEVKKRRNMMILVLIIVLVAYFITIYKLSNSTSETGGIFNGALDGILSTSMLFPYWMGIITLIVFSKYDSIILKIVYLVAYFYMIFFSSLLILVMQSYSELLVYVPNIIILLMIILVAIRRRYRIKNESNYKK